MSTGIPAVSSIAGEMECYKCVSVTKTEYSGIVTGMEGSTGVASGPAASARRGGSLHAASSTAPGTNYDDC